MSIFTVTTLSEETDGLYLGGVSLREAITAANATPGQDIIRFDAGLSGTISLTEGEFEITDSVVIQGLGADTLTIDAGGNSRVFNIDDGSDSASEVVIRGLTITGGSTEEEGGGIYSTEVLRVFDSVITGNSASDGGGIYSDESILLVKNSEITGNNATDEGGGIYNDYGILRVIDSDITENNATYDGGGIYSYYGSTNIIRGNIAENSAIDDGGAVYSYYGSTNIIRSNITENSAIDDDGGAIYNDEGTFNIIESDISRNEAQYGGAIYNDEGNVRIVRSTLDSNTVTEYGGGIYVEAGSINLIGSDITGNSAEYGGGIYDAEYSTVVVTNSEISGNSATEDGGGIYTSDGSTVRVVANSLIANNSAGDDGGGIYNAGSTLIVNNSEISDNSATDQGGGIDSYYVLRVNNSEISGNSADYGGGIYNDDDSTATVNNSLITGNNATTAGGGVYNGGTFRAWNSIFENTSGEFGFPDEFYGPAGVIVAGTNDDDEILGSNSDDIIRGRQGDDILAGGAGDDDLFGQAGSDVLIGFDPLIGLPILGSESVSPAYDDSMYEYPIPGAGEIDVLTGGGGADLFVLGSFFGLEPGPAPVSVEPTEIGFGLAYSASGEDDYALIKDFSAQDTILLDGFAELYQLGLAPAGLSGVGISTTDGELIAIVQGNAALDLDLESGTGFEFSCGCMG